MARAYPEDQPAGPTPIEVVWQRRPRTRHIPVRFITASPARIEPVRAATAELAWRPRLEADDKPAKD